MVGMFVGDENSVEGGAIDPDGVKRLLGPDAAQPRVDEDVHTPRADVDAVAAAAAYQRAKRYRQFKNPFEKSLLSKKSTSLSF
jgi:hypothetical protein